MKKFSEYQHVPGQPMSERDKKEANSKFWGKGKWDNFIAPLLPKRCENMTFVDMGCNAGLFLNFAEKRGFKDVRGVDSDYQAIKKIEEHMGSGKGVTKYWHGNMQDAELPLADYVVFANSHYYLNISDFVLLLDRLRNRTRFCLVVSGDKKTYPHIASSKAKDIRRYFNDWKEIDGISQIDPIGDPAPRKLWTLVFQSPTLKRVSMRGLDCGNYVQSSFYQQLDEGVDYRKTKYFGIIKNYRLNKNSESLSVWTEDELHIFFKGKIDLYKSVKESGLQNPIIINHTGKILDGNHRYMIMKHLGHTTILVREG